MTPETQKKVLDFLREKVTTGCTGCGSFERNIAPDVLVIAVPAAGLTVPSVALVCMKCGRTELHNAKVMGIEE